MKKSEIESIIKSMADRWPSAVVSRDKVGVLTGGLMSTGYMANLDSRGEGPPEKIRVGRKICYPVKSYLQWLMDRAEVIEESGRA